MHHLYAEHMPCAFYSIFQAGTVVLAAVRRQPLVTKHWRVCRYCERSYCLLNTGQGLGLLPCKGQIYHSAVSARSKAGENICDFQNVPSLILKVYCLPFGVRWVDREL